MGCEYCGMVHFKGPCPEHALKQEIDRLRAAITLHRRNLWGEAPVGHPEDERLYRVVSEGEG